ncbi:bifunctional riboflavin kinase/FAD synthetase [Novosphingobium sp. Gsoil 351]|uniref:bifunctional riboflavin kinase/FAD synthetase n=1 Tax=Novosphingobium sp. Gsoil 351 TaxID=2675225 RepID=UPI0012B4AD63|nr:bifunctional riboflavin kinase/FAD synthetase [Novosphingobium sp. Gsoil 351]QGN54821.1 bifunctional riboflavin kinase/FAD synthetase [Novosphingobium sp. Gsoil 351]
MRLDHRNPMPDALRRAILALGNFDGFHRGHQAVVGEAIEWAKSENRPAIVATFSPHPIRHFVPDAAPFRLSSLEQREDWFTAAGAAAMLVFHFDAAFAELTPEEFVRLLGEHIGAAGVVTGGDFTFGKNRGGDIAMLRGLGAGYSLQVRTTAPVIDNGAPVSSTRIRKALKTGDCTEATRLLTRPFAIRAEVQHGDKVGRTLGYPTANLAMYGFIRPRYGIYAVTGKLPDGRMLKGAANLGVRPTFDPPKELLEPYFFDFAEDLYGQEIEVAFDHFIRPEAKFDSLDDLKAQMDADCQEARRLLG